MTTTSSLRRAFLDYFAKNGHTIVSSAPLVPHSDPTLLFTNAGMVPFKNVFTGLEKRPYNRAVSSQKCVRAGGKHNDLDNVGYTARHHTFFEMLGNFSFGDYFKEQAVPLAWEFVTKELRLSKEKLLVTIYHDDEQAFQEWKKLGLPESRIIRISTNDNFWAMGDTGPCGPCSEIFYDHGEGIPGGPPGSADADGDRFIEIWNLVFMQFDQGPNGRVNLPKPSIDTGMGLERVAAVLQGVHNNYEIDLFQNLIRAIKRALGKEGKTTPSHRVIADHLRAACFLIADGVLPSNEGRGYVLRRILRRGMRHAHQLGAKEPLFHKLVPALIHEMGDVYQELGRAEALITTSLLTEETRFRAMLERGLKLLSDETGKLASNGTLPGEVAFKLYDTYGFPLDLTQDILRGENRAVDLAGFETAMADQRAKARAAWKGSGEAATDQLWFGLKERVGASEFLGYQTETGEAQVLAIISEGQEIMEAGPETHVQIITNQTPFYGESGGQMGDAGILTADGVFVKIQDTKKPLPDLHVHIGVVEVGTLKPGQAVSLEVDVSRRKNLRRHHSATHLLHKALREALGEHVTQKGSLVAPDKLRFDFSHPQAVSADDQAEIERTVNAMILENAGATTKLMTPEEAVKEGALALFGEKYGEEVRVVKLGDSVELCGGTHVSRTGDIGFFKITSESAISAGVRRLEAVVGEAAVASVQQQEAVLKALSQQLKTPTFDLPARLDQMAEERKKAEAEIASLKQKLAMQALHAQTSEPETINGIRFLAATLEGVGGKELRDLAESALGQIGEGVVALAGMEGGKGNLLVRVSDSLTPKLNAVDLLKSGIVAAGGQGGGGKPNMAQGGLPGKPEVALDAIKLLLGK